MQHIPPAAPHTSMFSEGRPEKTKAIFFAGADDKCRLNLFSDDTRLALVVSRFRERTLTDIYLKPFAGNVKAERIFHDIEYSLGLRLLGERILAITDRDAPNRRIVEIRLLQNGQHEWVDLVPESEMLIDSWLVVGNRVLVSYMNRMKQTICIFDLSGSKLGEVPVHKDETVRMVGGSPYNDELLLETESFTHPIGIFRYCAKTNRKTLWARRSAPFDSAAYGHSRTWFTSKDGTRVPMYLAGRRDILDGTGNPTVMTAYGGHGVSASPQFSVFVAFLMERGCLFALPNIRGGSEFGIEWHNAAKGRNRQTAYDDFLSAAEWLIETGRTDSRRLAIFGGSNSGLLVGAAVTQRPDLFRAAVCMAPMLDMLRYHLFDNAYVWKGEFGTAEEPDDFTALLGYSPYHQVRDGTAYPATMIVSGDADRNCNPLHARKMTARLQAASISDRPILLDYSTFRGHSPVLPLSQRIDALTDRMAFLCDQLQLEL